MTSDILTIGARQIGGMMIGETHASRMNSSARGRWNEGRAQWIACIRAVKTAATKAQSRPAPTPGSSTPTSVSEGTLRARVAANSFARFILALLVLALTGLATPVPAQLSLILTPADQSGNVGQDLTYNATLVNQSGSTFTWDTLSYSADSALNVNLNNTYASGTLANNASTTFTHLFDATPSQLGTFSGTIYLTGAVTTVSQIFRVHSTPPPPGLLVALIGGALMLLLNSRASRKTLRHKGPLA